MGSIPVWPAIYKLKFMLQMKNIVKFFIIILNIPFILITSIYVLYNMYKHIGIVEMTFIKDRDLKEYLDKIYPNHFKNVIAIVFYMSILFYYLNLI